MGWFTAYAWSPYAAGVGIGLLSCFAFVFSDKPIGCSTAFARSSGMLERLVRGPKVNEKPYYKKFAPEIDWEWMLVLGVLIGAFLSAVASGSFRFSWLPARWAGTFGVNPFVRWLAALFGGVFMGFGARWAGGCTSGHGISGTLQLAVSGWIAAACFFIGGIVTAQIIYRVFGA